VIATPDKTPRFYTSVGAASTGVLVAFGIRSLVGAIKIPLTAGLAAAINSLIKWQHLPMFPLAKPSFLWSYQVSHCVTGLLLIALALKIAFWLAKRPN
jgi:hypothetical protein